MLDRQPVSCVLEILLGKLRIQVLVKFPSWIIGDVEYLAGRIATLGKTKGYVKEIQGIMRNSKA